jgi:N-acetylneuraminate synthase
MAERPIRVGARTIGPGQPTYFIADIGANHDGDLDRARALVRLAADSGADAAKFQHFAAPTIISRRGFEGLGDQLSHQASWPKPVYDVYADASLDLGWTEALVEECREGGVEFMTSPYSFQLADAVDPFLSCFKIGSGEITWLDLLRHIARKGKPVMLATGGSTLDEVERAVETILAENDELVLLQCNTNYTGSRDNFSYVNLHVLETFRARFPDLVLGLSDHTPGLVTTLGAVALGARVVEKHITDDRARVGPDHAFALDGRDWRELVERTRDLEAALGDGVKRVEANEQETVVLQRRALRATRDLQAGETLADGDLFPLRPCPPDAVDPAHVQDVLGRRLRNAIPQDEALRWADLD